MAATSLSTSTPKLGATFSFQTLLRKSFPISLSHPFLLSPLSYSSSISHSKTLNLLSRRSQPYSSSSYPRRRFTTRAESNNGAEPRQYDFDLFTIGAGSGGVRASRFAANFGASVAVCELPFATISSETTGGVGGT